MARRPQTTLSRRERQIMDIIYEQGRASVTDVRQGLPDPPSYSAVRTLLAILEAKGHLKHVKDKARYIYSPTRPRGQAGRSAMRRVLQTFYDGSVTKAAASLLDVSRSELSQEKLDELARLIDQARRQ